MRLQEVGYRRDVRVSGMCIRVCVWRVCAQGDCVCNRAGAHASVK